jgi:hypothetical protein
VALGRVFRRVAPRHGAASSSTRTAGVVGHQETALARTHRQRTDRLQIRPTDPVLVMTRITLIARSDRFEIDYLIDS